MPVPVIVGVGDVVNRSRKVEDAVEPLELILQAVAKAFADTGLSSSAALTAQFELDSLDVVRTWTWPYPDLPALISERLRAKPARQHYTDHGGNQPAYLLDEAARRISKGESKLAIITGGEALASSAKHLPPPNWTPLAEEVTSVFSPTTRELKPGALPGSWKPSRTETDSTDIGSLHGIGNPIHIYPLYENAYRARNGQSLQENHRQSAEMYAQFAKVAEGNEYAWNHGRAGESAERIGTVGRTNRMICFPYPLLMNAFNTVNLAAACIITSTDYARELGIGEEKWVYPLGGAGTQDSAECSLETPELLAIAEMTRQLRAGKGRNGLILANGGVVTYQHVVVLSREARKLGVPYPDHAPLPKFVTDVQVPAIVESAEGSATIETYTVEFGRAGEPARAFIVGRLKSNGQRFIANHADQETMATLSSFEGLEPIGRSGLVSTSADGRNLFGFGAGKGKL
ncbi:hypothetical protein LTR62_004312 [Meristemomyces frigidus]|uniref:Thiolase-like protein type 1 additional C-terminal domain-containing protein n=1 Tax=Meristemomyces frigidus TaxID=1508187 RepID=A0AAN7TMI8_9PEZI|nr:hypothetical protein LTR62_004312 [Meristemomyces frigidus]